MVHRVALGMEEEEEEEQQQQRKNTWHVGKTHFTFCPNGIKH